MKLVSTNLCPHRSRWSHLTRDSDSKIDLIDPPEVVAKKVRKAVAVPQVVEDNGVLAFVEFVLLPAADLKGKKEFRVERERDGLEPLVYTSISQMHEDYKKDLVTCGPTGKCVVNG